MAELQTIAAAFDVARLAWEGCKFLKKVVGADRIVAEVHDRTLRLKQTLDSVRLVLEKREENGVASDDAVNNQTESNISDCIEASKAVLLQVRKKVGGFTARDTGTALLERVKIALRHPSVSRLQIDLEARISALQADLSILQLSDQAHTHATVRDNHEVQVQILTELRSRLDAVNVLLVRVRSEQRKLSLRTDGPDTTERPRIQETNDDARTIESLEDCLRIGEDLHERYTSEWAPDDRSLRFNRRVASEQDRDSPLPPATPESEGEDIAETWEPETDQLTQSETAVPEEEGEDAHPWPLEILNRYIHAATERASREREQGHFNQAEVNLQSAIRYSEMRQRHYDVPFDDRVRLQEEVARVYQKQGKFAAAVGKVHQLLPEASDDWTLARQHQLLASIHFDRHHSRSGAAPSHDTDDVEKAEMYARKAFTKQFALLKSNHVPDEEAERYDACTALLIRILETRDKSMEANELKKILSEGSSSFGGESMRRISSARPTSDFVVVEDKHELLVHAIRSGDSEQAQSLLTDSDADVEKIDKHGKTLLFHAVEHSDETVIHKLLDPAIGADVNACNKRGLTALHHAATHGLHDMVRCLLHHDAEIEAKDKRDETPLMKAVQADQSLVVQVLSDCGADLECKNVDEWSVIHFAIRLQKTDITKQLLDLAPDLRDAVDVAGKTALHHCTERELVEQAKALLTHKNHVDVSALDACSRSALYLAASKPPNARREAMVQLLVKQGAIIDESRPPPRWRDYEALNPRRPSKISRVDSVSTSGSVGTASTVQTKLSRIFSGRMHLR